MACQRYNRGEVMKKLLLILAVCFLTLGIVACNNGGSSNGSYFYEEKITMQVDDCFKLDYVDGEYTLESEDQTVIQITHSGMVKAIKEGKTNVKLMEGEDQLDVIEITVTANTYVAPETETAEDIYSIVLNHSYKKIYNNGSFYLVAKVYKNNNVVNENVVWNCGENNPVIKLEGEGNSIIVKGLSYGKTTVRASIGKATAVCNVTVASLDCTVLSAPTFTAVNETSVSWSEVENAENYKISTDGGLSYKNVEGNSFEYGDINLLYLSVVAVGDDVYYSDSQELMFENKDVEYSCGDRMVLYSDKTVSGVTNTDNRECTLDVYVNVANKVKVKNVQTIISSENVVSYTDGKFFPVADGETTIKIKGAERIVLDVIVGTPIKTKVDMDTLAFSFKLNGNNDAWAYGKVYILANDIDYATDVAETDKVLRMTDNNDVADIWDRYLIPIAASMTGGNIAFGKGEWGIFGKVGGGIFYSVLDGDGHAIKNAVIPYGIVFGYSRGANEIANNNFIGTLAYGGKLCNIAFTGLEFEDPVQIAQAGANNPYYTSANPNNVGKTYYTDGTTEDKNTTLHNNNYITGKDMTSFGSNPVNYGSWNALNMSNFGGLVGSMQNAVVENVFVEAMMKNGTYGVGAKQANGLIVACVESDYVESGVVYRNMPTQVKNCITVTSDWTSANVNYYLGLMHDQNNGMGSVIGFNGTEDASRIENCFTVKSGNITNTNIFANGEGIAAAKKVSTNCGVYDNVSALQQAQSSVLANMSIAKYLAD